ncbi:hypothetical protein DSO57_1016702 [Entomophthora muscae]|uniref:Uncharacterized protein n=1 Tax=Entomophthora muscae TaxID=34485 RepID=A0ACC2S6S0_9FUNG|nr:hypothetical protein DSO57_1016702 [Entomophthora muscae]
MRPCLALWLPESVVEPIEMLFIQQRLNTRHREDRKHKEERNQDFEVEANSDPMEPTEERTDVEESPIPYTCHPSMDKWCELHQKKKPQSPPKAKPKNIAETSNQPMETGEGVQNPKAPPKKTPPERKGTSKDKGMSTDFSPEEFASFQKGSNPGV